MDFGTLGLMLGSVLLIGLLAFWLGRTTAASVPDTDVGHSRRLEEYDFYPFVVNVDGHVEFDVEAFNRAVLYLLAKRNNRAARELIVIGEQNLVRETFPSDDLQAYKSLFEEYDGDAVVSENAAFLENYKRLVNQIGRSFPSTGIEVLLHDLVNPARSLVAIENGEVTGRSVGSGATNLVLDLKTRRQKGEAKVNYELNIGTRQFKCTTVPIFRPEYGLVGAVCINIDTHFIRDALSSDKARLEAFVDNLLRTDFELDENILSKDEYQSAIRGKRHYLDEAIRSSGTRAQERKLVAILFSDIVGFTSLMSTDEEATLQIVNANENLHMRAFSSNGGRLLKRLGDGLLASFDSATGAVECAQEIQREVAQDGRFRVRVGIHLGEVVEADGDVHGDGVNIASRIQGEVEPGQIGISQVVYANVRNKPDLAMSLVGERSLKGVSSPISLYLVDAASG